MYCRSLLMISRSTLSTSNIASRCLIASCNNHLLFPSQQHNRYLAQNASNTQSPGRVRRFFRWFTGRSVPISSIPSNPVTPPTPQTTMQRVKRLLALSPLIERFFIRAQIIQDEDLARLVSKTTAIIIYAFIGVTTLGTFGIDTKPLLAGIGITGFTIGFALKEVATNFISGIFLVINKPFVRGCRIQIHGSGGGIEGLVHYIDVRYVHLKIKDQGIIMVPSAIVYTNPFTVFPADEEANAGFLDMTKPSTSDPTKPAEPTPPEPSPKIKTTKQKTLKMSFDPEPAGSSRKAPFDDKL